jgi:hypothetical protein
MSSKHPNSTSETTVNSDSYSRYDFLHQLSLSEALKAPSLTRHIVIINGLTITATPAYSTVIYTKPIE